MLTHVSKVVQLTFGNVIHIYIVIENYTYTYTYIHTHAYTHILLLWCGTELWGKLFLLMLHSSSPRQLMKDADLIPFQSGLINALSWGLLTEQNTITIFFNPISLNTFNKIQILVHRLLWHSIFTHTCEIVSLFVWLQGVRFVFHLWD